MSETPTRTTELTSHYSTLVTDDLAHNLKEQDRVSAEIEALQAQLAALKHDNTVLVSIQEALGVCAELATTVPAPREKLQLTANATGKRAKSQNVAAPTQKRTGGKRAAGTPTTSSTMPKLVDLVRVHLARQNEPCSAAEVTASLEQQQPDRSIKATVVRATLEGLVAKNKAQRSKQGSSVFYTAPGAAQPVPAAETESQPEPAGQ